MRMRLLLRNSLRRTGSLLRPVSLNNWAAAVLTRLFESRRDRMWRLTPVYYVNKGTNVTFNGKYPVKRTQVIEVEI